LAGVTRPFRARELALALVVLGAFAILAFGPHLRHGGFYMDDWSSAAISLQPPAGPDFGSALSSYADLTVYRPVLVVYVPLTYLVFGMHMHFHLVWATALAVLAVTLFYGVLRTLKVPWIHAMLIAALALVFPWSDSTRLWVTADQITLSIAFATSGILVALTGLDRKGSWRWHACAVVLYLLSILSYEVTLPLIACVGVLYCFRAGWRAARPRWLADLAAAAVAGIWVGAHTTRTASGLGGDLEHLWQIVEGGETILARAGLPLGAPDTTLTLLAIAAVLGAGTVAYRIFPTRFASKGWGLREWLLLAVGGLAVAALGWAMFVPADPYYTPSIYGETNRVNGLAGFGVVLLVYGTLGVFGSLIGQVRPRARWVAAGATVVLALALLGSYTHVLRRHIEIWNLAYAAERTALVELQRKMPHLPHGTTVIGSSYPANQTLGVPILATTWDFDGMVKMEYDDSTLSAYPVLPEQHVGCRDKSVTLEREGGEVVVTAAYGSVRLLNFQSGRHSAPRNRRECRRVANGFVPGPLYLSTAY
jgi:hypothetical protein